MERKSYASIEMKTHPLQHERAFDFEDVFLASDENETIVDELLSNFAESIPKEKDGTGEWEWLQNQKQNNFIAALNTGATDIISKYLTNMFRNEATYGYLSPSYSDAIIAPETVKRFSLSRYLNTGR